MEKKRLTNLLLLIALLVGGLGITIAYAAIQTTLDIRGTANMQTSTWNTHFANLSAPQLTGTASVATPPTLSNTTIGNYSLVITQPGDSITYTFDVTNEGDLDGKIGTFTKETTPTCTGSSPTQASEDEALICGNLTYTLTYTNGGATVALNDTLAAGQTKNMTLTLSYDGEDLPSDDVAITGLDIIMVYVQDN